MGLSVGYIVFTAVHFLCFALAIAVCGLYGQNISKDDDNTSKWVCGTCARARVQVLNSNG